MSNKINLKKFKELVEEHKKTNNKTIELQVDLVLDILDKIEKNDIKIQILLVQKYNLVLELKNKGISEERIKKILDVREK